MTFSHGAGVDCPGPRIVTYSRPPSAKPPSPLKNSSSGRGAATVSLSLPSSRLGAGGAWLDPLGPLQADDLVGEAAPTAEQDGPGSRLEERPVLGGELVAAQDGTRRRGPDGRR